MQTLEHTYGLTTQEPYNLQNHTNRGEGIKQYHCAMANSKLQNTRTAFYGTFPGIPGQAAVSDFHAPMNLQNTRSSL